MDAQEMHIEIDLLAQKIRSNYYRKFQDSEIDWLLNKHVDRFIKDRIKQDQDSLGFDATEIDLDALRTLVVLDRELSTFQGSETDAIRAELPGNYAYLIDDFSNTTDKCDIRNYNIANQPTPGSIYVYSFPLMQSTAVGPKYYQNISFTVNGNLVFSATNLPGLPNKTELFTVRNFIMDQLAATVIQSLQTVTMPELDYYWEEFGNIRKPGCILAVSRNQQIGLNQLTIDGGNTVATEQIITRSFYPEVNNGNLSTNRLIRGAFRSQVRLSAFAGTTPDSPISAVSGNNIKVYHDGKFIVSKLRVSYVRKPAKISLLLNQNCDLAPEFHREICDRVVLDIKELTLSPDWEVRLRDLMMNKD